MRLRCTELVLVCRPSIHALRYPLQARWRLPCSACPQRSLQPPLPLRVLASTALSVLPILPCAEWRGQGSGGPPPVEGGSGRTHQGRPRTRADVLEARQHARRAAVLQRPRGGLHRRRGAALRAHVLAHQAAELEGLLAVDCSKRSAHLHCRHRRPQLTAAASDLGHACQRPDHAPHLAGQPLKDLGHRCLNQNLQRRLVLGRILSCAQCCSSCSLVG